MVKSFVSPLVRPIVRPITRSLALPPQPVLIVSYTSATQAGDVIGQQTVVKFTDFTTAPNTGTVGAGSTLFDGWIDNVGTDFDINGNNLRQTVASVQRYNQVYRPPAEAVLNQTVFVQFVFLSGSYVQLWSKFTRTYNSVTQASGYRAYILSGSLYLGMCVNGSASQEYAVAAGTLVDGGAYVFGYSCAPHTGGGTALTINLWTLANWQTVPRPAPQATVSAVLTDPLSPYALDTALPPAVSASAYSGVNNTIQGIWVYNDRGTLPGVITTHADKVVLGYLGSSTWYDTTAGGTVPGMINATLASAYPSTTITTVNGAFPAMTTGDWIADTSSIYTNLRNGMAAATGYKIVRMMIGSNDANAGVSVATWLANMTTLINSILAWPVHLIILEEIGVRLDNNPACPVRIQQYNEARSSLLALSPKIKLGGYPTYKFQAEHLNQLSSDHVHQLDAGQVKLAANQASELVFG